MDFHMQRRQGLSIRKIAAINGVSRKYLYHATIANTQIYLHPSSELLVQAGDRFAAHASIGRFGRSS